MVEKEKISAYIELTKPRIVMLVLVTAYLGYYLGLRSQDDYMNSLASWRVLLYLLLGTWATSASSSVLNQVIERIIDFCPSEALVVAQSNEKISSSKFNTAI